MNRAHVIAQIVASVRAGNGETVDESTLAESIEAAFAKLQREDEQKYLEVIKELSEHVEILSKELGRVRTILQHNPNV
jgi:hypothetical protein